MKIENIAKKLGLELSLITEANAEEMLLSGIDKAVELARKEAEPEPKAEEDDEDEDQDDDEDEDEDDEDEDARDKRLSRECPADLLVRDAEKKSAQALELSRRAAMSR